MEKNFVDDIRSFNRFYTNILGLLDNYLQQSTYTLPEVRILFELYYNENRTARELIDSLRIDKGYLSRILQSFEGNNLISRKRQDTDNRNVFITLTPYGKSEFKILDRASHNQIKTLISGLSKEQKEHLIYSMSKIQNLLSSKTVAAL